LSIKQVGGRTYNDAVKSANKTIESLLTPIPIIWIWAAAYQASVNKLVLAHCFRGQCGNLRIMITITMEWWQSLLAVIRQLQLDIGCLGYATVHQPSTGYRCFRVVL